MRKLTPRQILIVGLALVTAAVFMFFVDPNRGDQTWPATVMEDIEEVPLSQAYGLIVTQGTAEEAAIMGNHVYVRLGDAPEESVKARLPFPAHYTISELTRDSAVPFKIESNPGYEKTLSDWIFQIFPILIIALILIFLLGGRGMRSLGLNSSFHVIDPENITDSFESVAGIDNARGEIEEIVTFLKDPKAAARLGGRMPKGAIFSGPPGTGKTLLARAMAKEAGVPFMAIEAAGINQLFVGAGAMKIKRAFREARKNAPCIVFIDEIDAMGRARGGFQSSAGDEKETTLNALLVELDGFDSREGVVVIAATNRPEILDKALTRRGRIDRHIHIDLPDIESRLDILSVHLRDILAEPNIDLRAIAGSTFGFSGADLRALVNEAALHATRNGSDYVRLADFEAARDRMMIGMAGAQRKLDPEYRHRTAVHEAGHALIAAVQPEADPVEKVTILPQGQALGYVMQMPDADRPFETYDRLIARMRVIVAGRAAEEIVFGRGGITTGAASDISAATSLAQAMVLRFGMGQSGFVAWQDMQSQQASASTVLCEDVKSLIAREMTIVISYLAENRDALLHLAHQIETQETLSGDALAQLTSTLQGSLPTGA